MAPSHSAPVVLETRVVAGSGGGPDKTILNSPRFLVPHYRTVCAYLRPPGDDGFAQIRAKAKAWDAPLVELDDRGPLDLRVLHDLLRLCRREKVAIWHGHDYKTNLFGLLLARFWPMRLVTTVHGWVHATKRTPLYYWIDRRCLPRYERVIGVSQDLCERALECGVPADRCILIENAIDTDQFRRRRSVLEARKGLGLPATGLLVGAVGRLSAEKGFDLLIRAVDQLLRAGHDLHLILVGEGDERPRLEALVAELGRGDRVHLLGYRADTRDVYEAMDLFALSSLREGLPNVVLEALALEVPVVATRIAGIPRVIRDGDNGLLVEPGTADELARALAIVMQDAGKRAALGQAGRRTVEESYSFRVRMEKIRDLYDRLLETPQ
jgi:glycosyltransferase involved in cell wall biosynthesis